MSTGQAVAFGALAASLVWALVFLSVFVRFVASDLDGFRKWLDRADGGVA
jgi:hypothetical protein